MFSRINSVAKGQTHGSAHDFSHNPMIIYWEMTQACELACRHCRAEAIPQPHPLELNHEESQKLLQQILLFGDPLPHLILTGGDPIQRSDLGDLIGEANRIGLNVSITPSVTPNLTDEGIARLKAWGIQSLGLSIDGSTASRHDAVRQVEGCFHRTLHAAGVAGDLDIPIQVNSLVAEETVQDLPAIYEMLKNFKVMRWSLFFLIAVGRGRVLKEISPDHGEKLMNWIYSLSREAPFAIKTTEAPSYRRIALNRMLAEKIVLEKIQRTPVYQGFGIRDGHGIMFVSNTGDIYPAGFLPLAAANVRQSEISEVYRHSLLFRSLHDPDQLKGKCRRCEFRVICGGSRARAFAYTGDPLESDPFCLYEPPPESDPHE